MEDITIENIDIKSWLPEFKVSAETDIDLQNYIFKTPEIKKLINSKRWLILGRKGIGKTAIYKYLETTNRDEINGYSVISLNFKDYPWPIHRLYKEALAGELTAYQKSWKYLFFVKAISKLISIKESANEPLNKELKWAKTYIEKIYGKPDPSILEVLMSKIARISKIKGPGTEISDISLDLGELSFDKIRDSQELQTKLRTNAYTLLNYFEHIFKSNVGDHKFMIVLDQLDENWLHGEIEEYSKVLINLINVCRNIAIDDSVNENLKIVPFLRPDIYQSLWFNDKNKVFQDNAIIISWDHESLNDMFFERVKKFLPPTVTIASDKKSGALFEISYVRQGTPPFNYITRRSFFRPRDIIIYFNKIRDLHKQNKTGLYTSGELYKAEVKASDSTYEEIIDEWGNQFPEIKKLLGVLQLIKYEAFTYNDFAEKCKQEFPEATESDCRRYIEFLFDNSIVGQKKQTRWEYPYSVPNLKMNIEKPYKTHQSLKHRLGLIENRPSQEN